MRTKTRALCVLVPVFVLLVLTSSCSSLDVIADAFTNLQRLRFRIAGVTDFRLAGIDISRRSRIRDFSVVDAGRLALAFRSRRLPASFVLEIEALNPNDGSGGSPRTVSTLTSFDWRLLIDGRPTIAGDIRRPFEIPGTGRAVIIPLHMRLDLVEFFAQRGYEWVINLALAIGGFRSDLSRLSLDARPRVSTPYGDIYYPGRLTIVDHQFR